MATLNTQYLQQLWFPDCGETAKTPQIRQPSRNGTKGGTSSSDARKPKDQEKNETKSLMSSITRE